MAHVIGTELQPAELSHEATKLYHTVNLRPVTQVTHWQFVTVLEAAGFKLSARMHKFVLTWRFLCGSKGQRVKNRLNSARLMGKFVWERCSDITSTPKRLKTSPRQHRPSSLAAAGPAVCGCAGGMFHSFSLVIECHNKRHQLIISIFL